MSMRIEQRIADLERALLPRDERGKCPACRMQMSFIDIDDDGNAHCSCGAPLEPDSVPRNVKVYVGIRDGDVADED
jgi:hypothetical protein